MRLSDLLSKLTLLRSQKIKVYAAPGGEHVSTMDKADLPNAGKLLGRWLNATVISIDANNNNINISVERPDKHAWEA